MKYKNVFFTFLLVVGLLVVASLAMAEEHEESTGPGEMRERKVNLLNQIKTTMNKNGRIVDGTVTAVNGTTFTVKNNEKTFTVTTDANTKCVRHFFGKCSLSEIVVNDKVNVWGTFTDDAKTTLLAREIRDASIMKKHGAFIGDVVSKGATTFVIKSKERGQQTVTVTTSTRFIQRNETPSSFADLQLGQRVRVKGVWDKANSTITEVTEVKNYSIPVQPTKKPSVAPSTALSPEVKSNQ